MQSVKSASTILKISRSTTSNGPGNNPRNCHAPEQLNISTMQRVARNDELDWYCCVCGAHPGRVYHGPYPEREIRTATRCSARTQNGCRKRRGIHLAQLRYIAWAARGGNNVSNDTAGFR